MNITIRDILYTYFRNRSMDLIDGKKITINREFDLTVDYASSITANALDDKKSSIEDTRFLMLLLEELKLELLDGSVYRSKLEVDMSYINESEIVGSVRLECGSEIVGVYNYCIQETENSIEAITYANNALAYYHFGLMQNNMRDDAKVQVSVSALCIDGQLETLTVSQMEDVITPWIEDNYVIESNETYGQNMIITITTKFDGERYYSTFVCETDDKVLL